MIVGDKQTKHIMKRLEEDEQIMIKAVNDFVNMYDITSIDNGKCLVLGYNNPTNEYLKFIIPNQMSDSDKDLKAFADSIKNELDNSIKMPIMTFTILPLVDTDNPLLEQLKQKFLCVKSTFFKNHLWIATKRIGLDSSFKLQPAYIKDNEQMENLVKSFELMTPKFCLN